MISVCKNILMLERYYGINRKQQVWSHIYKRKRINICHRERSIYFIILLHMAGFGATMLFWCRVVVKLDYHHQEYWHNCGILCLKVYVYLHIFHS